MGFFVQGRTYAAECASRYAKVFSMKVPRIAGTGESGVVQERAYAAARASRYARVFSMKVPRIAGTGKSGAVHRSKL